MMQVAGHRIAMGHAVKEVQEIAVQKNIIQFFMICTLILVGVIQFFNMVIISIPFRHLC